MPNPFELVTASKLSAKDAVDLWCDDKRIDRVKGKENCFINGHRGTGKSMLFRILQHDCQALLHPDENLPFVAVYLPVRDTEFVIEEMELFQDDAQRNLISESHFSVLVALQLLRLLRRHPDLVPVSVKQEFVDTSRELFARAFRFSPHKPRTLDGLGFPEFLVALSDALRDEQQRVVQYLGLRLHATTAFDGPLFMFDTLLGPVGDFLEEKLGKRLYVLVDDGDDLPESYTIVLNTWIARRHSSVVFKVSTMFGYKTYDTRSRSAIQHPHDFLQFDIATRFLIQDGPEDYVDLLRRICEKRLAIAGISANPGPASAKGFFPEDEKQARELQELKRRLQAEYEHRYGASEVRHKVYRHLTSEYVKELNRSRSAEHFVYSGFRTVALLSSGMVRDFITCAQRMYDNASRESGDERVAFIPPLIQSSVLRAYADEVLREILDYKQKRSRVATHEDWQSIRNLVEGLGSLYKTKMLSSDSERRVFSFAFHDDPGRDLVRLLGLAVEEGYLTRGFIGRKDGTGRRELYVLTRRLAPAFNLDVSAYSGYLSLLSKTIRDLALNGPIREDRTRGDQLALFELIQPIHDASSEAPTEANYWIPISPEEAGR